MVCDGFVIKLVQSHDMEDCQPFNQVQMEATPNNPIQTIVVYQPPQTLDMPANIKQILQEVSSGVVKQIVPSDANAIGVGNVP
jgi:hypothetical protein